MEMKTEQEDKNMTGRQMLTFVGSLFGCMLGAASIHSVLVVPAIMNQVNESIREEVGAHEIRPHRDAAHRDDLNQILDKIDNLPTKADFQYLKDRLGDFKQRVDKLEGH